MIASKSKVSICKRFIHPKKTLISTRISHTLLVNRNSGHCTSLKFPQLLGIISKSISLKGNSPNTEAKKVTYKIILCNVLLFSATPVADMNSWLDDRALMTSLIQQHLSRAQTRMKRQADKHRSERSFAVGDWVFLKVQPYVQSSLARRANQKLAFWFFGPYQILERIGAAAYKLALPSSSSIHPVFHVSQLKVSHGKLPVSNALPDDLAQF